MHVNDIIEAFALYTSQKLRNFSLYLHRFINFFLSFFLFTF